jgi:hypothetical protein
MKTWQCVNVHTETSVGVAVLTSTVVATVIFPVEYVSECKHEYFDNKWSYREHELDLE